MNAGTRWLAALVMAGALALNVLVPTGQSRNIDDRIKGTPPGWTDDIRLTNNTLLDYKVALAAEGSDIHMVWQKFINPQMRIYYLNSKDAGKSWSNEVELSIPRVNPDIVVVGQNVHVVFDSGLHVYYRNSSDGGLSWNPEKMISTNDGFNSGGPKVFVNNSNVHIAWMDIRDGPSGEIYYRRSLDSGITFDNGQGVDTDRRITSSPSDIAGPFMAGDGSNISIAWADFRNGVWEVYWMISKDNGVNWEDGLGNIGSDRRLTTTGADVSTLSMNGPNIYIIYVDPAPGPVYSLYCIKSLDSGATWSVPQLLTGPNLYSDSPDIAINGNEINLVWFDRRDDGTTHEIYYKNSTDGGASWSEDIRLTYNLGNDSLLPQIALANGNRHITWYDYRDGNPEIYYKRFPDFPIDATPPTVSYISPPTPPDNSTLSIDQKAVVRAHYYDNESACTNATLFWKNATEPAWHWQSMTNVSFWNGSYNNYFEANFTESAPTAVTYYVNCTSSANLTMMAAPRTVAFSDAANPDPYPIWGRVELYNGNAAGFYLPVYPTAPVDIDLTYWNNSEAAPGYYTYAIQSDAAGYYAFDLYNTTALTNVYLHVAAFPGYGNAGDNYTTVDVANYPMGREQKIVCGVPYDVNIITPLTGTSFAVGSNVPFQYEIRDRGGVRAQGYYDYNDGLFRWLSNMGGFVAPALQAFDGVTTTMGVANANIIMSALGTFYFNATEQDLVGVDPYLTPWNAITYTTQAGTFNNWLRDWHNITLTVAGGGFEWRLYEGWNLVSSPQNASRRTGANPYFDAQDALAECIADGVTDPNMKIANKLNSITPSTYVTYTLGDPEASATNFPIDPTSGYWVYVSSGTIFAPILVHFDALDWPSNGTVSLNLAGNWNLIGYAHNRSIVDWSAGLTATDFATGVVDPDINVQQVGGTQDLVMVTYWYPATQWYESFVRQHDPWFPGVAARDWDWDSYVNSNNPGVGCWLWVASACVLDFDVDANY